eukprot:TRINITY_DN238_c0_g3_i1.p1 TRINITY_DN238_c0_g3~~TRINITY_DN238_c0_g3_i1.p1  ORF type:complete len:361 (-),score=83.82 TRINITY_DN238_c0_g3_i1:224-1258(-)
MGTCSSLSHSNDEGQTKAIEHDLRRHSKLLKKELKLLLLGAGESGKTTFTKQIRILYLNGYSPAQLTEFRAVIYNNIVIGLQALLLKVKTDSGLEILPPDVQKAAEVCISLQIIADLETMRKLVSTIWECPKIKEHAQHLEPAVIYFLDKVDQVMVDGYQPTEQDVLRARVRTTGVGELVFNVGDGVVCRMIDVGGQRSERRKWIHFFEGVTAVIFFAACSEYDQTLQEAKSVNRMHESLTLFKEVCNCQWFTNTHIILFLNKRDIFEEKIKTKDLKVCFPEYDGGCNYDKALGFIKNKFTKLVDNNERKVYIHVTVAVDTENIRFVFESVRKILLQTSVESSF